MVYIHNCNIQGILTALKILCLLIHLSPPTYPHNHWFLIFSMCFTKSLQLCVTLCNPMDCSPPGSSVHGILQARILEWVAMPFSRGSSWPRDRTQVSGIAGKFFTIWASWEAPSTMGNPSGNPGKTVSKSKEWMSDSGNFIHYMKIMRELNFFVFKTQ